VRVLNIEKHDICDNELAREFARMLTGFRILRLRVNLPMDIDGFCWPSRGSFSWGGDGAANCEVMKNLSAKELVLDMRGFRPQLARSRSGVKANLTAALHNGVERLTTVIPDIAPAAGLKLREALGLDEHLLAGSPWLR